MPDFDELMTELDGDKARNCMIPKRILQNKTHFFSKGRHELLGMGFCMFLFKVGRL